MPHSSRPIDLVAKLASITARLARMRDLDTLAREAVEIVRSMMDVEYASLYVFDPDTMSYRNPYAPGFTEQERQEAERTAMDRHIGKVIREGVRFHVDDTFDDPDDTISSPRSFLVRSRLWLPIASGDERIGAIGFASATPRRFTAEHIAIVEYVATVAGVVYGNLIAQRELRHARDRALAADRAKGEFLANVSHEIRTPLNGVVGMTELLLDSQLTEAQQCLAQIASRSARTLTELIEDLLDFSRLDVGALVLDHRPFSVQRLTQTSLDMLQRTARSKQIDVRVEVDPELPETLLGDGRRVQQVIVNLVGNALKFTEKGYVTVRLAVAAPHPTETLRVRVEVEDSGIGIPVDHQPDLFSRFYQGDSSVTRRFGGTGLGLSISAALVKLMGGEIGLARSQPGVGSTFWFELPLRSVIEAPIAMGSPNVPHCDDEDPVATSPITVLIVDDSPTNRTVAGLMCARLGWQSFAVDGGAEALAWLAENPASFVLMDVHMPDVDGITITERLRAAGCEVPVLFVTADVHCDTQARCFAAGGQGTVHKPVTVEKLADAAARLANPTRPSHATKPKAHGHTIECARG